MMSTMIIRYTQEQKIGNKQSHDVDHDHQVHSRSKDWKAKQFKSLLKQENQ